MNPKTTWSDTVEMHSRRTKYAGVLLGVARSAGVTLAVDRYRREHAGVLPPRLADLVLDPPLVTPVDPFSGKPLLYRRTATTYTVYSVGPNRADDGGGTPGPSCGGNGTQVG